VLCWMVSVKNTAQVALRSGRVEAPAFPPRAADALFGFPAGRRGRLQLDVLRLPKLHHQTAQDVGAPVGTESKVGTLMITIKLKTLEPSTVDPRVCVCEEAIYLSRPFDYLKYTRRSTRTGLG